MGEEQASITLRRPDDLHVHLREGAVVGGYARDARAQFARVLVMPNTVPPVLTAADVRAYREQIERSAPQLELLMTFKLHAQTPPGEIAKLKRAGAVAGKLYPQGATTNSEDGLSDVDAAFPLFEAMEREGLVLCIHGEDPSAPVLEREQAFLPALARIVRAFPRLRVVLEHVSSAAGVNAVVDGPPTLAATVTAHHLLFTLEDLLGGKLSPHLFCKPVVKANADREAIQRVVLEGNPRFFFGSDSAPHPRIAKERGGAAGVYSMPVSLPLLAQFFSDAGAIERFEPFVSEFGAQFYRLPPNEGKLVLRRGRWRVPDELHGVVPLLAGTELGWIVETESPPPG